MVTARTKVEINSELRAISKLRHAVPAQSVFGDDNRAAIRAQMQVLEECLSVDEVQDRFEDDGYYVLSAALTAQSWLQQFEDSPLSKDWSRLTPARKGARKRRTVIKLAGVEQRSFDAHLTEAGRIHARGLGLILD